MDGMQSVKEVGVGSIVVVGKECIFWEMVEKVPGVSHTVVAVIPGRERRSKEPIHCSEEGSQRNGCSWLMKDCV